MGIRLRERAILEAKWPWPGKFAFHFHGIPEERGAMGYFNVTNPPVNAIDGKDVATTKSINMVDWQANLTKTLQKANPNGTVTTSVVHPGRDNHGMTRKWNILQSALLIPNTKTNEVLIVKGAATLGDKSYSPIRLQSKLEVLLHGLISTTLCTLLHLANLTPPTQGNYLIQA